MEVSILESAISSVQVLAREIYDTVSALPEHVIRWKPAPDKWSIQEILGHMEEAVPYWANEMERVVSHSGTEWGRNHEDAARLAALADCLQRSPQELLAGVGS